MTALASGNVVLASFALLASAAVVFGVGRAAPLLGIVALVGLFPVTTIGPWADALGGDGNTVRAIFIVACLGLLVLAHGGALPKPPRRLRPVVAGLVLLAALGLVSSLANAGDRQSALEIGKQLVGQPLAFAALLIFIPAYLSNGERARDRLLVAFSVGVVLQAALVIGELLSGAAYDELRDYTRAQGTVGANFLGAFAMMALFVGLAERTRGAAGNPRLRIIGTVTIIAALSILIGAVARGALLGVLLGGGYVLFTDPRYRRRAGSILALGAVLVLGSLLTPAGDLWTSRLDARAVQSFDRGATWISGLRIGSDNLLTGLSEAEITDGIDEVREYRQTPLGETRVIPHNVWILAFAQGGFGALLVLIGTTVMLVLALRAPRQGRSREERLYVAALIGIAAIAAVNNVFTHPELMVPLLLLSSLVVCRPDQGRYRRPATEATTAVGGGIYADA